MLVEAGGQDAFAALVRVLLEGFPAAHALCAAHLLRELTAVTETGTTDDAIWARQAIDALAELNQAAGSARAAGEANTRSVRKLKFLVPNGPGFIIPANLDSREAGRARLQCACGGADQDKDPRLERVFLNGNGRRPQAESGQRGRRDGYDLRILAGLPWFSTRVS